MSDYASLAAEVENSDALRAQSRIRYFADVFHIFARNYTRLSQLLTGLTNVERVLPIWDVERRDDLRLIIGEVLTYVHNYLASARTLVEHTRIMVRANYDGGPLLAEYQQRIEADLAHDPLGCLIHDLRNYMLHYSLPSTFAHLEMRREPNSDAVTITSRTTIKRAPLLSWSGWSPEARAYLQAADADIDLLDLVSNHYERMQGFNQWLLDRLNETHAAELEWLSKAINRLTGQGGPDS